MYFNGESTWPTIEQIPHDKLWQSLTRTFLNHGKVANNTTLLALSRELETSDQVAHIPAESIMKFAWRGVLCLYQRSGFFGIRDIPNWNEWVPDILGNDTYRNKLTSAGIYDAVRVTTKLLHIEMKSDQEWLGILSRWSTYSHTMITAWGKFTFTLEDVSALLHLPMLHNSGESLENPFDKNTLESPPDDAPVSEVLDEHAIYSILLRSVRHGGKPRSFKSWVDQCRDGEDLDFQRHQLACFLLTWLTRYVFPGNPEKGISQALIPLAIRLSGGVQLPLGPLYLGSLYARLDLLHEKMIASIGVYEVMTYLDILFIQMCLWERFPLAAPTCKQCPPNSSDSCFRAWAWYNCKGKTSIFSLIDKENQFEPRPYVRLLGGYGDPSKYPRVVVQFGFDQLVPHKYVANHGFLPCLSSFGISHMESCSRHLPSYNRKGIYSSKWKLFYGECFSSWDEYTKYDPLLQEDWVVEEISTNDPSLKKIQSSTTQEKSQKTQQTKKQHKKKNDVRLTSSSPRAGCGTSATPATPRTSPLIASSVTEVVSGKSGFHDLHVKPMYVAALKDTELKGGKFWESTFLESEIVIAGLLDQLGEFILKAKTPNNLSLGELVAMSKTYDDCVRIKFNLDFMESTRTQLQNVIVGLKFDPEAELVEVDKELAEIDAREKQLKASLCKLERQRNNASAKRLHLASISDSLNAFRQGASFFP
ncbi:hypothetical protein COLO4_32856 [Corchorus olitorius]|uniref:Aminotransferase-like plant mobile domain-containing protein n=1 Tax=Corchorus olitorius TaxID=93759 RepID=A0A1R3GXM1_9ROSI|nr:hypothetical protein COLO4_32856 [Corchorus olitorius]